VVFSNGWIAEEDGRVLIYYASSDSRLHVATSTVERLVDYVTNTAQDGLSSAASVHTLNQIIDRNLSYIQKDMNAVDPSVISKIFI
jgi:4-O-beta-D-mannosyl-D-glucose phosphorylase